MRWIAVFLIGTVSVAFAADRPNILFIYGDDIGYGDFSCYGGEVDTYHLETVPHAPPVI